MGYDIPYGDPSGMREFARRIRAHADSIESILGTLTLPDRSDFRGRIADSFRGRHEEIRRDARVQRDRLQELASWLDGRAEELQRQIDEAQERAREAERRRQQMFSWWPWR